MGAHHHEKVHKMTKSTAFSSIQYACAVILIITSIALACYQVVTIYTVAHGLLIYIAQAFLLAGSIFGLDYYVNKLSSIISRSNDKAKS